MLLLFQAVLPPPSPEVVPRPRGRGSIGTHGEAVGTRVPKGEGHIGTRGAGVFHIRGTGHIGTHGQATVRAKGYGHIGTRGAGSRPIVGRGHIGPFPTVVLPAAIWGQVRAAMRVRMSSS